MLVGLNGRMHPETSGCILNRMPVRDKTYYFVHLQQFVQDSVCWQPRTAVSSAPLGFGVSGCSEQPHIHSAIVCPSCLESSSVTFLGARGLVYRDARQTWNIYSLAVVLLVVCIPDPLRPLAPSWSARLIHSSILRIQAMLLNIPARIQLSKEDWSSNNNGGYGCENAAIRK